MYLQTLLPQPVRQALLQDIQGHLLQDVLGFWTPRACDVEHGGYHTHFDRQGRLLSNEKNTWLHARRPGCLPVCIKTLCPIPLGLHWPGRDATGWWDTHMRGEGDGTIC